MMQVILVRHAETEWNVKNIIQGHSDSALTLRGERQTSALLAAFAESDYRVECVYASPLGRAWQMGQRLAERFYCSLIAEPALKEQAFGQFEGMTTVALLQKIHDNAAAGGAKAAHQHCGTRKSNGFFIAQGCHIPNSSLWCIALS